MNYLAIITAAAAVFIVSTAWYMAFGRLRAEMLGVVETGRPPLWKIAAELFRSLVLAAVIAGLASRLRIIDLSGGVPLGLALWLAFPAVLLAGSVQWDRVPWQLAAIHAGDWLLKLLVIVSIVVIWH